MSDRIEYTVVAENGKTSWYLNGKRDRKDGPAVTWSNGSKAWHSNGKYNREHAPAI